MGQLSRSLSQLRRARQALALLLVPVLAALVALLALAVSSGGVASSPADGEDEYEPDRQVVAAVQGYAQETGKGYDHVLRWMRVLKSLGALEGMTAAEAQDYAEQHLPLRWDPVAEELIKLENGQDEPDPQLVAAVRGYAQETKNGYDHVLRWVRVLDSFGALEEMTAAEAQGYADRGWPRWVPVAAELAKLQGAASNPTAIPESGELEVSISASPTYPRPGNLVKLSAVIANAPAGSNPTYLWQLDLGGNSLSLGRAATASYAQSAGPASFLLTVSYPGGASATSSITVEWTETPPNLGPVVNRGAEWDVAGKVNAPRGYFITRTFTGLFSDPDGDELSYSASVPDDQRSLVDSLEIHQRATTTSGGVVDFLLIIVDSEADWKAVSPALADPLTFTVTLTATDPGGLSASVTGDFFTDWESHPALINAVAGAESVELSFDQELQADPAPASDQFTVNVTNEDGSTGTIAVSDVSVNGKVLTLELASALQKGQTVSLDYSHDDDAPLQRAAAGGDSAPSFEAQAVELVLSLPPVDFAVSPVLGTLDLLATWDQVAGATSYNVRWRQAGGEFDEDDAFNVSGELAVISASDEGQWEVRLQACNDNGCGPETSRTVDVTQALNLNLAPARDAQGNTPPGTITATWDPVPGATSYTLSWQPAADQAQGPQRSATSGPSAASGPGSNGAGKNQLTVSDDRTGVDIPAPGDGEYRALLQANTGDNRVITQDTASVNPRAAQSDTTPPKMVRGEIDGDRLTVYFSEPLDPNAAGGRFYIVVQARHCHCWLGGASDADIEISGNKVTVDFQDWIAAGEGLWAATSYEVDPSDSAALRDLAGNRVPTPNLYYDGRRGTRTLYLDNLTGRPFVLPVAAAGTFGPSGVAITSDEGDDQTYEDGETIRVTITFSEAVNVTGTPRLKIDFNPAAGGERWADYAGGDGTEMLEFTYTVVDGDSSTHGVAVLQDSLVLNGGTIRSASAIEEEHAKLLHAGLDHDLAHKVVTPASAPPALYEATVTAATLTLTFSETLGAAASLANSAFTVKKTPQGGSEQTVSLSGTPSISADALTLTLANAVLETDSGVMVSYEKPTSGTNNKLIDADGNETASFTDQPVTNAVDTTPPELLRGEIDGDIITLFFSEPLDETMGGAGDYYRVGLQWNSNYDGGPTHGRCRSTDENGGWIAFTTEPREVHVRGNTVVVVGLKQDPNSEYRAGAGQRTNNIYYVADMTTPADQRLRDLSGNHVLTPDHRSSQYWWTEYLDLIGVTELPAPERITVDGDRLTLTFDAPMDSGSRPAASAFTVKVAGVAVSLASANPVAVSGRTVALTLASAVASGANVTVTYAKPSARPLQNVICEDAPGFDDQPVTNLTGTGPTVSSVAITSDPGDDQTYGVGDTIRVAVTFSAAVDVFTAGNKPRLQIKMDPAWGEFWANYESGSGTDTLVFSYTVMEPNTSPQGIAVVAHSLQLNGGLIRSMTDPPVNALLDHTGLGHDANHKVDWRQ